MNRKRKSALSLTITLTLILLAGLASSCDSQPSTPVETGTAVGTATATVSTVEPQAGTTATAPVESADETPPPPDASPEAVPEDVKEVAEAVAARTAVPTPTPNRMDREIAQVTAELGLSGKTFLGIMAEDWIDVAVSALIVLIGYFVGVRLLTAILKWIAERTSAEFDDSLLIKIAPDLKWLVVLFFARFAFTRLDFLSDEFRTTMGDIFFILGLVIVTTIGMRAINQIAAWYKANLKDDDERLRLSPIIMSVQRLSSMVLLVFMLSVGLSHFGIDIGALSITILVLAVVVSIGAKDTISDAISGFVILVDQPFRVHDGVQIQEFGTWGDVIEIGTRTTRILTRDNREVIIPNTKMLNSRVMNYTYPDPEFRMQVNLHIVYGSDLDKASQVIMDALRKVDGVLPDKDVEVLFVDFGDTARKIRVRWWVADYHQDYVVLNKVCRAIDSALNQAGIDIPITTYDLNVRMQSEKTGEDDQRSVDEPVEES